MKILLIEDDTDIAELISRGLEEARYDVDVAYDGSLGFKYALSGQYGLVVLDLMLPGTDGWGVCEALRRCRNTVPILMLTAYGAVQDRVRGLEMGADDYLPKPFDFAELLARIRALLRRDKTHKSRMITIADLQIDTCQRSVTRNGREVLLTPREYTLLEALARHADRVLSREFIERQVWPDEETFSNVVDVCIGRLRRKIDFGHEVKLIQTVHRLGYRLKDPAVEDEE